MGSPKTLTSEDDPGMELDMATATTSGVATLEPYLPDIESKKHTNKRGNLTYKNKANSEALHDLSGPVYSIRYLTLRYDDDQRMQNSDFFEIHREIINTLGREPKIVFQGNGSVLVEVTSLEEKEKLLSLTALTGKPAKCAPHKSMNQSKGVIRAPLLMQFSEERLQKEFESQNVTEVKQMKKKIDGVLTPLPTYVLTFDQPRLPRDIKAAWLYFNVKPYVPVPRRCFYCHRFGHINDNCRKRLKGEKRICHNCGKDEHGECERTPFCVNCQENHPSVSKTCDRYVLEREILAVRSKEHITYPEAKRIVLSQCIRPGTTFASVIKKSMSGIKPNKPDNIESSKKTPVVPQKIVVTSTKRRLSNEDQDNSPLSKSNRYEILNDELDCTEEPAPNLFRSEIQAEVHVSATPPEQDGITPTSSESLKLGEATTLVSAPNSAETHNMAGSHEQTTDMAYSPPDHKKLENEKVTTLSCRKVDTPNAHIPNRIIKIPNSNHPLSENAREEKEFSSGKTLSGIPNPNYRMPKNPRVKKEVPSGRTLSKIPNPNYPLSENTREKKEGSSGKTTFSRHKP